MMTKLRHWYWRVTGRCLRCGQAPQADRPYCQRCAFILRILGLI